MKLKLISLLVLLSLVGISFGGGGVLPVEASTYTINEPFNTFTHPSGWSFLGSADMVTGWLQLTPYTQNKAGAVFYNRKSFSPYNAYEIEFDYGSFGGSTPTHADGLSFFMIDGNYTPTQAGNIGGSLGYAGMAGAYFAVGLDEYHDMVSVWDSTHVVASAAASIETGSRATPKHVRIVYSANTVSVWLAGVLKIDNQVIGSSFPTSVKVGFSAATGSGTNYHEIHNVVLTILYETLFVKPAPSGSGSCADWTNACTLQTALASAGVGSEIWAAEGVYKPTGNPTERTAVFQLPPNVALYGGFDGQTDIEFSDRDPADHPTILSGDIDNNDSQTPIITDLDHVTGNTTNSYNVVKGADGALLDGFTFTGGCANGDFPLNFGAGLINEINRLSLINVTFSGNLAAYGGGMADGSGKITLINVTFTSNSAFDRGGGMFANGSILSLINVTFSGNIAEEGGGIYNNAGHSGFTNVTFSGNAASRQGGAMYNGPIADWSPRIYNSLFWGNTAGTSGAQIYDFTFGLQDISDSIIQGGWSRGNNILTADPKLGWLGNYGGFTKTIPLRNGSSALDAANAAYCPATDQRGVVRPQGAGCDIGAFEGWVNYYSVHLPLLQR